MPFDVAVINRDLYIASVKMGSPNSFLAWELGDAVAHILASENPGATLPQDLVVCAVARTVREFGYDTLATEYESASPFARGNPDPDIQDEFFVNAPPRRSQKDSTREMVLKNMFSPDISAGIEDGWIQMQGITHPDGFLDSVWPGTSWVSMAACYPDLLSDEFRKNASQTIHLFGPTDQDYIGRPLAGEDWKKIFHNLHTQAAGQGICLKVHWNQSSAHTLNDHPLFPIPADETMSGSGGKSRDFSKCFFDAWSQCEESNVWFCWHMASDGIMPDFLSRRLGKIQRFSLIRDDISEKQIPGNRWLVPKLEKVFLRLDRLAKVCHRKGGVEQFLERLPSLVRFGIAAGLQKRQFLRKLEINRANNEKDIRLAAGFALDKAMLWIAPKGLQEILERLFPSQGPSDPKPASFCKEVFQVIRKTIREESGKCFVSLELDISNVWEIKESKIKQLMDSQLDAPLFKKLKDGVEQGEWFQKMALTTEKITMEGEENWERLWVYTKVHELVWA